MGIVENHKEKLQFKQNLYRNISLQRNMIALY